MNLLIYVSAIPEDAEPELRKLCVSECLDRYVYVTESFTCSQSVLPATRLLWECQAWPAGIEAKGLDIAKGSCD